ncbi:pantetheine-phosphate adenylyltransferase [Streptococcus parauberis]|uniref:Phosphopantetheine adenylyltransferase n=3 Tax=Streptococcus parauberis TaxID=1348 RepID=A0A0E2UBK3_9STRE|nr:pantetheine-phosphate adenylyltransferase [Streptococcus parauberis]AEF25597.1 phosphopantetheine adenylyltransferase [Streptococcus parauberis KCTC 11537]AUT06552.1 Pantetheine-phosphate adenylyltransferase [Streptococcus parauberis]EGE53420.1 pantetheine-phosphate adenylyltransferase [Streptococcus parauberis NCFD 2020]EMF50272.1 Phosphopantetheine adenylyltransferase [Streptococcus parauberis KRS-02109]EMG25437.1 Phosphopantetheine adenylyltransferase [Streptococcus parauberis KRS-02083]
MSNKIGLYSGSFDPVTNGHMDIIDRASQLFDKLYVGIFYNTNKAGFLDLEGRIMVLEEALASYDNVSVVWTDNRLAVDLAKELEVTHMVRGLRNPTDFEYESNLEYFNHRLDPSIDTVYLIARNNMQPISSSRVKELIHFNSSIEGLVPQSVISYLEQMNEEK